jgi:BirA family biotin operon repressor/biotin-[acetyl-CoA-carboxylase] ligase
VHVHRALAGSRFADVRLVLQTGSTNDDATALLAHADALGATIIAEEQTAGRGRRAGRTWLAQPGTALLFTTILPLDVEVSALWAVPFWVALGVADGLHQSGVHAELRWPNDLFLGGRKAAGILCISRILGECARVGCGVGVNVVRPLDLPAGIDPPPAFLSDAEPNVVREVVLTDILLAFEARLGSLRSPAAVARTYEERAGLIGARYRVRLDADGRELDGIARGLGADGALRLEVGGTEHLVALADARRL